MKSVCCSDFHLNQVHALGCTFVRPYEDLCLFVVNYSLCTLLLIVGCHSLFTQQRGQIGSMYSEVSNIMRLHGGFVNVSRLFS